MKKSCNNCASCAHYRPLSEKRGAGYMRGCPISACTINRAGRRTGKGAAA